MSTRIYCFINSSAHPLTGDMAVVALCEDGHQLAGHISSSITWAKHDIGITSDWKHDLYRKHCPDGYELEWIDDPDQDARVLAAAAAS